MPEIRTPGQSIRNSNVPPPNGDFGIWIKAVQHALLATRLAGSSIRVDIVAHGSHPQRAARIDARIIQPNSRPSLDRLIICSPILKYTARAGFGTSRNYIADPCGSQDIAPDVTDNREPDLQLTRRPCGRTGLAPSPYRDATASASVPGIVFTLAQTRRLGSNSITKNPFQRREPCSGK